jgi:hypothetical protein
MITTFSEPLQQIIDTFFGDLDDTLLHLYDQLQVVGTKDERNKLVAMYNDLAAHINKECGFNAYKLLK